MKTKERTSDRSLPLHRAYTYTSPRSGRIVAGVDALARLPDLVRELGMERVALVTSPSLGREGRILQQVTDLLGSALVTTFSEVQPHSPIEVVRAVLREVRGAGAQSVISLGGGSCIDTAKGVIWYSDEAMTATPLGHIAIPSTLSGAEYTTDAGITIDGLKRVHRHERLVPTAVILDPDVAATAPLPMLRSSLLNALAHCLEGVASLDASPMTDAFYLHAIRLIRSASSHLDTVEGRMAAQAASGLAALHQVRMGLAHALVHVIGGRHRTPHGVTHAIVGPAVMRFNLPELAARQAQIAAALGCDCDGDSAEESAWKAIDAVRDLAAQMGVVRSLHELGIPEAALDGLADDVLSDSGFATNPRPLTGAGDARVVLDWAWSGEIPPP
jgi:alcohol dehydrogenase class IV